MVRVRRRRDFTNIKTITVGNSTYNESPVMKIELSFEECYRRTHNGLFQNIIFINPHIRYLAVMEFHPMNLTCHGTIPMLKHRFKLENGR